MSKYTIVDRQGTQKRGDLNSNYWKIFKYGNYTDFFIVEWFLHQEINLQFTGKSLQNYFTCGKSGKISLQLFFLQYSNILAFSVLVFFFKCNYISVDTLFPWYSVSLSYFDWHIPWDIKDNLSDNKFSIWGFIFPS